MPIETFFSHLETELQIRGFDRIETLKRVHPCEFARFMKRGSPIEFQVGIEEESDEEDQDPECYHLDMNYTIPARLSIEDGKFITPDKDLIRVVFGSVISCTDSSVFPYSNPFDQRLCSHYQVDFRNQFEPLKQGRVLAELVDYVCNHLTTNCSEIEKLRHLKK